MSDWNASDSLQTLRKPNLLDRLSLTSPKTLTKRALSEAGGVPTTDQEQPRLANIAAGLAERLGLGTVDLFVLEGGGPNALTGRLERPVIAVTTSLLDTYARTELEAVVAHCLVRYRDAGRRAHVVGYADDVRAAALTRYPPALAAAIAKADPYRGRYAGLYLVADGPTHRPTELRIEALADL